MTGAMHASEILEWHGIKLPAWRLGEHRVACPHCQKGKRDQTLGVRVLQDGHATWHCHRCQFKGSTRWLPDELYQQVKEEERHARSMRAGPAPHPHRGPARGHARHVLPEIPIEGADHQIVPYSDAHERFWDRCEPITSDCPVGRYLIGRGCPIPDPAADLRWRPDWPHTYEKEWRGPCMVGRITDAVTGEPRSFHFSWVQPDGSGKAPLKRPRLIAKGMPKKGGVIRLSDDADLGSLLLLGEGLETTLAGQGRLSSVLDFPVPAWATIDADNLACLPLIEGIHKLVVLVDHDQPNTKTGRQAGGGAFDDLYRTWSQAPCELLPVWAPTIGQDAADLALAAYHAAPLELGRSA